ncbi:MAG TPA: tyrosine-type recombinase/integrase [candidate division Zixibacteria bacterium]|nr:tyrosine-type recombinase/integrase [candidate division Zixibacteria bacterium]
MKVSEAIDFFMSAKEAEGISPNTVRSYNEKLWRFCKWAGDPDISAISVPLIRSYIAHLQPQMRAVSVASYIRPIKVFCRFLEAEELTGPNPFRRVKVPAFEKKLHDIISDEDFRTLLNACNLREHEGRRNAAILCFLVDTGVRVSEMCNLKRDDLDIKGRWARIFGKGGKERIVFFSAQTAIALTRYLSKMPARYRSEYVFTSMRRNVGGRMTPWGVGQMLQRLKERTGVQSRVNPHTFRHTFATNYLRSGGDLNSLMRLMGHADLTILQNYLALANEDLKVKHDQYSPLNLVMGGK